MTSIHINTDEMRQLAGSFEWWSNNLRNGMVPTLHQLTGQLEGDWQGVSRQHYDELIRVWQENAMNLINSAEDLSRHLMNTANQFENVDNS
jgi:WXG100 family type VII secretion target